MSCAPSWSTTVSTSHPTPHLRPCASRGPDAGHGHLSRVLRPLGSRRRRGGAGHRAADDASDAYSAILGTRRCGRAATKTTSADTPRDATIAGEHGYLSIPGPYYQPGPFTVFLRDAEPMFYLGLRDGHEGGLHFSAVEAATIISAGATESVIHPPPAVLATLDVMDRIRAEIGIVYPGETTMTVRVGVIGVGIMGADHARKLNGCVADAAVTARRRRPASLVSLLCRMRHRDDKRDEKTTLQMRIDKLFHLPSYFIFITTYYHHHVICTFSNPMSTRRPATWGWWVRLTRCPSDFVSPSCPIFLVCPAVSLRDVWWDEGCPQLLRCAANNCTPTQSDFNAIEFRLGGSSGGSVTPRGS